MVPIGYDVAEKLRAAYAARRPLQRRVYWVKSMANEYIEQRDGGYFIKGARVSLDSLVYAFLRGASSEGIADPFRL